MARKKRVWYPGAIYHVMSRGTRRMALFRDDEDYQTFLEFLCMIQEKRPFLLHAYCLMTNHFHMELETAGEPIWDIMKNLLGKYAGYYNFRHHFQGHLFESRYHAILIEETTYFLETSRYIHLNPVKAGIVNQPEEYRYSSYRYYVSGKEYPLLQKEKVLSCFQEPSVKRYQKFVEDRISHGQSEAQIQKDVKEDELWLPW